MFQVDRHLARPLDQNLHLTANQRLVVLKADGVLDGQQLVVPKTFDVRRYIVWQQFGGLRSRPLAVFEDETVLEPTFPDQSDRLLIVLLGLSTKPDNKIAGNRGIVRTARARLDELALGGFSDRNVAVLVNEGAMDTSLLGMSYLRRFQKIEIADDRLLLTR